MQDRTASLRNIAPSTFTSCATVATLALGLLATVGCVGRVKQSEAISESADRYVRLETVDGGGQDGVSVRSADPVILNEQDWGRILKGFYVRHRKSFLSIAAAQHAPTPAFNESDAQYLARYLTEAFGKARPDQWVVFYLSQPREPGVTELSSGGFLVESGEVHLMMANYRQPVSMAFIQQRIWNDPLRPAGEASYDLVPQKYQTLRADVRSNLTKPFLPSVSELVVDYAAFLRHPDDTAATSGQPPSESGFGHGEGAKLEEKLRTLQRLREQGLITEEEYQVKRQKLLEKL